MKAFASWSGGKDCMYALHRFLKDYPNGVHTLLNMCDASGDHSGSHGIPSALIKEQASCMNLPLFQQPTSRQDYEQQFKLAIAKLKSQGVDSGIFGDIYLQAHRDWIERVCSECGIVPIFPLWGEDTAFLLKSFIDEGFKAITVAVKSDALADHWLDRQLDLSFYNDICRLDGIDPCAEQGEYHTFVFDGPLFQKPVAFTRKNRYHENGHLFLSIRNL